MTYGNKIQKPSDQDQLGKEHHHIVCMDSAVFLCPIWGGEQKEPFSLQRVFSGELQATNGKPTLTRYQQVFGVYKARKTESKVCKSSAEELSGECNQWCGL